MYLNIYVNLYINIYLYSYLHIHIDMYLYIYIYVYMDICKFKNVYEYSNSLAGMSFRKLTYHALTFSLRPKRCICLLSAIW